MTKKVYVVTSGCYSDYHICRIFEDKENAIKYRDYSSDDEINDVEEYTLSDIPIIEQIEYAVFEYPMKWMQDKLGHSPFIELHYPGFNSYNIKIESTNTLDFEQMDKKEITLYGLKLIMKLSGFGNKPDGDIIDRFLKICYDIEDQLKYRLEDGMPYSEMISLFDWGG
jgi:hypothetical protein